MSHYTEHFKDRKFHPARRSPLVAHCLLLWYIADYFGLPELKAQAVSALRSESANFFRNAAEVCRSGLLVAELRVAAGYCYAGKGRDAGACKDVMLKLCYKTAHRLYCLEKFHDLLQELPEFASDLAWAIFDHRVIEPRPRFCGVCTRARRFCRRTQNRLSDIEEQVQATTCESTLKRLYKSYYQVHRDIRDVLFPNWRPKPHCH